MANYASLAATAERLIRENGREMTLRSETASGDAWNPTLSVSDSTVVGVVTKFSAFEVANGLVEAQDKKILFAATVPLTNAKRIIDGGVEYSIINVETVKPGYTAVLYKAQVRK